MEGTMCEDNTVKSSDLLSHLWGIRIGVYSLHSIYITSAVSDDRVCHSGAEL